MANRNQLLFDIATLIGIALPDIWHSQNVLLHNIAKGVGGASDISDNRNTILADILTALGGTPLPDDNRNILLSKINITYDVAYKNLGQNRNILLTDWLGYVTP